MVANVPGPRFQQNRHAKDTKLDIVLRAELDAAADLLPLTNTSNIDISS